MRAIPIIVAATLLSSPAFATPGKGHANGHNGQGRGNHNGHAVEAPLPAAAGIPALLLLSGIIAFARRRTSH